MSEAPQQFMPMFAPMFRNLTVMKKRAMQEITITEAQEVMTM